MIFFHGRNFRSIQKKGCNFTAMNPYHHHHQHQQQSLNPYEQKLRDEVIYLHSLWQRGPPTLNPDPIFLRPSAHSNYSINIPSRNLHVLNTISFKKTSGNRYRNQNARNIPIPSADPGPEWPVNSPPSSHLPSSGWPPFKEKPSSSTPPTLSEVDEARIAAMKMQQKVLKSCNEFFAKWHDLRDEEDGDFEEEDEENDSANDDGELDESKEFQFFFGWFVENRELRDFYEKNSTPETGDFYCLVCGKMFKGCLGLLQHTITILKTKRKRAHRAFGQVICRVLGWDINRLPVIVLKGDPLSQSLANLGETLNCLKDDDAKKVVQDFDDGGSGMDASQRGGMVNEEVLQVDKLNRAAEELDSGVPDLGTNRDRSMEDLRSEPSQSSDVCWLCSNPVQESQSTPMEPTPNPPFNLMVGQTSAEEQARFSMVQLQLSYLGECQNFLSNSSGFKGNEDEDFSENDLLNKNQTKDWSEECEEFKFFLSLFTEGNDLRNYYENHHSDGEFFCMVCGATGKNVSKRFDGCISLLEHATTISRTNRKRAHRAFGQVICKVLAWDVDQLPAIVLKGEPLSFSLKKSGISQTSSNGESPQKLDKEDINTDMTRV